MALCGMVKGRLGGSSRRVPVLAGPLGVAGLEGGGFAEEMRWEP